MNIVVLAGIPGTGSTTVLNKALEEVDYVNINYGNVMFDIASENGLVETRDDMRKLDPVVQKEVQQQAAQKIHDMAKDTNVIIDTHCTIRTPKGFLPGLPSHVLEKLQPTQFILIEADGSEIMYRRMNDDTRVRDVEYVEELELHQELARATAMSYSVFTGCTVSIVQNHDDGLDDAVSEIVDLLS